MTGFLNADGFGFANFLFTGNSVKLADAFIRLGLLIIFELISKFSFFGLASCPV